MSDFIAQILANARQTISRLPYSASSFQTIYVCLMFNLSAWAVVEAQWHRETADA